MKVELLQPEDEKKWDKFVSEEKNSFFCHVLVWRDIIKKIYRHKDLYLVAKERGEIRGILPSFIIKHPLFGKKIISLPFCGYGGVVSEDGDAQNFLLNYLKDYTRENKYDFFELRSPSLIPGLITDLSQFTFILDLKQGENALWKNKFNKKIRNQIRKANKFDLQTKTGNQYLTEFYKLYQKTMKKLGTPIHNISFMKNIIKEFCPKTEIIMVKSKDDFIAGLFLLFFKKTAINLWAASDFNYARMNQNDFLYWETIKYCIRNGFEFFDFGRSQINSGTFHFKKQWGADMKQLYYQYYCPKKTKVFSDREKYGGPSRLWKKLPSHLVNLIGPMLRKYLP